MFANSSAVPDSELSSCVSNCSNRPPAITHTGMFRAISMRMCPSSSGTLDLDLARVSSRYNAIAEIIGVLPGLLASWPHPNAEAPRHTIGGMADDAARHRSDHVAPVHA